MAIAAFAFGTGCGDNDNNDNGGGVQPTATRTATPKPVATPTVTGATPTTAATPSGTASVAFAVSANGISPFSASFDVTYDAAKGSFTGAGATTACTLSTGDAFVQNDNDAGLLKLAINSPNGTALLTLPATVTCPFEQTGGAITAGDLTVTNKIVAVLDNNGVPTAGDATKLDVGVTVTQP